MIVCVCHAVSEQEIRRSTEFGIDSFEALQSALGVGTCCGQCTDCAKQVLAEHLDVREASTR